MMGAWTQFVSLRGRIAFGSLAIGLMFSVTSPVLAVVKIFDGFGDGDRNNDGLIAPHDTDINLSGTLNDPTADAALATRGITEVTTALDPTDVGIVWSGIRSYDTAANIIKCNVKIINDTTPIGTETASQIFNDGYALSVEARGGGSSFMGRFNSPVSLGPVAGDKLRVSFDFRAWEQSTNPTPIALANELRWGIYQDTDHELGTLAPYGNGGANVKWGTDDGNFFSGTSTTGAEGDKGIRSGLPFGQNGDALNSRIQWEYNQLNINGSANTARILEGNGTNNGGDTGTIADPNAAGGAEGPGGILFGGTLAPHNTSMELVRNADGTILVSTYVDTTLILSDTISITDAAYSVIGPPPDSFDYVAMRDTADFDWAIDNFKVEVFGSNAGGVPGDYNNNNVVDAADYTVWRDKLGSPIALPNDATAGVTSGDYDVWKLHFGQTSPGSGSLSTASVPEPVSVVLMFIGGLLAATARRRDAMV